MGDESGRVRGEAIATLAMLHPGIEPIVLGLLVTSNAARAQDFGWIVAVGQLGMAAGAILSWRWRGAARSRGTGLVAAAAAIGASVALALATDIATVLVARLLLGVTMGLLFAQATAGVTRSRPHHAIGTIYFAQQILAAAVMMVLPVIAAMWSAAHALAALALVPLGMAALLVPGSRAGKTAAAPGVDREWRAQTNAPVASIGSMALLIAVTMMMWSYMATTGEDIGLRDGDIGFAIALGSLASAPPAAFAALRAPRLPPMLIGSVCGMGMIAPLIVPVGAGAGAYLAAMIAFNAGSAFAIVRFSGWAMERSADARARRFVTAIQCIATAGGPAIGAVAMRIGGLSAIAALAMIGVAAAALIPLAVRIELGREPKTGKVFAG